MTSKKYDKGGRIKPRKGTGPNRKNNRVRAGKTPFKFKMPGIDIDLKPKKTYSASRNEKQLRKIFEAVEQDREQLEEKYDFMIDYDKVETPEGKPTFEEFVLGKTAAKEYNKADPLWKYTKMSSLGPISYQRWRGARTSKDGKNYRVPYFIPPGEFQLGQSAAGNVGVGAPVDKKGRFVNTSPGWVGAGLEGRKKGHRIQLENRNVWEWLRATPGSLGLTPLNYLGGGASASGGAMIPGALGWSAVIAPAVAMGGEAKKMATGRDNAVTRITGKIGDQSGNPAAYAGLLSIPSIWSYLNASSMSIPTGGFMRTPFKPQIRKYKKESKQYQEKMDRNLSRSEKSGEKYYDIYSNKERKNFERQAKLYEKKYGYLPKLPEFTYQGRVLPSLGGPVRNVKAKKKK